jgi:hypothetical protein
MKSLLAGSAALAIVAVTPALADSVDANSTGGKPSSTDVGNNPAAKNIKSWESTPSSGASSGEAGRADQEPAPGAAVVPPNPDPAPPPEPDRLR